MITRWKIYAIFLVIFASSLFFYYPSLTYYFFQDDWFVLNWVQTQNLLSLLGTRMDIIYWRPLSMPLLFLLAKNLFGLNPLGFHLIAFSIFFALIYAIYKLFLTLGFTRKLSITASFLYGIWPIHFISLSWFSTTSYIIGPLFQVLSFIFFSKFTKQKKNLHCCISYGLFLLGIASSEFTLVLPLIFLAWGLLINKKNYLKFVAPYLLIDLIYVIVRFYIFPIPARDDYQPFFNRQVINNFFWYIAWSFGFPESFKSLIFPSLPLQSVKVITQFWTNTLPVFLLSILLLRQIISNFRINLRTYFFALAWFAIGLAPVITVTKHSYPLYLSFAGLGFLYLLINLLKTSKNSALIYLLALWIIISFTNLQFTRITHWVRNEQAVSKAYIAYTKQLVTNPPENSAFLFKPANITFSQKHQFVLVEGENTLRQSLNDQNSVQVIYNDSTLKSFYFTHQQTISLPKDIQIFEIAPRK